METESKEMERASDIAIEGDREDGCISKLPQDTKELVFAKLSIQSICVSRVVSREWNSILSSQIFLSSLSIQNPWLLICSKENHENNWYCMAYCFSAQKWMTLPLPNREGGEIRYCPSTAQGLLLFGEICLRRLFVCNPLTRSYTEMENDLAARSFHIVQGGNKDLYLIVYNSSETLSFKIYHYFQDSRRIKCQFGGEMKSNIFIDIVEMVECNGVLFWMGRLSPTIVGYNIKNEGFIRPVKVAPLPPEMLQDLNMHFPIRHQPRSSDVLSMVSYGSSVLVVGTYWEPYSLWMIQPVTRVYDPNRTGIVIWELFEDEEDELVWKWREFAKIPPWSLHDVMEKEYFWDPKCVCVGDYLCFRGKTVFAYNLKARFWQRLPPHEIHCRPKMMSFEPKLYHYQFPRKWKLYNYGESAFEKTGDNIQDS
ncbi:hypothetical protein SUGI_0250010 [Cryptomeria japonica]|uniref:uncharacterized protein LOC131067174 n=1 Tax=Cryptomeria japonica TaxID=3369 RepID=UPI002408B5B6|nr:uncharacterized protein LOC131067174 [Cryptomeria japonica]GLJ15279.1 hypothetical protein SUGI_0250010 [Cryptomeria japonica]